MNQFKGGLRVKMFLRVSTRVWGKQNALESCTLARCVCLFVLRVYCACRCARLRHLRRVCCGGGHVSGGGVCRGRLMLLLNFIL